MNSVEEIGIIVKPILEKYGIRYAGVFGSYARGDARPDSDVDILVSFGDQPFTLLDMVGLKDEISEKLNKPVDLVSERAVVSYFKDYIYRDLKPIYEQR